MSAQDHALVEQPALAIAPQVPALEEPALLAVHEVPRPAARKRIDELLERFWLTEQRNQLAAQVLVVNRNLQAVHITTARRAFVLMFTDAARALDVRLNGRIHEKGVSGL